jgi:hypothetical protein
MQHPFYAHGQTARTDRNDGGILYLARDVGTIDSNVDYPGVDLLAFPHFLFCPLQHDAGRGLRCTNFAKKIMKYL